MKHLMNNATEGLAEPWVACKDGRVYYMPKESMPDYDILITYNVTDISAPTTLFVTYGSQAYLTEMSIDNGEYTATASTHQFDSVGEHKVGYKVDNSFTSFNAPLFYQVNATKAIIADSVVSISTNEFLSCSSLTSVTIGDSVTSIGSQAFQSCSGLTSLTIPNSVISIGTYAFNGCSSLTSVIIPNSVTSISDNALANCSSLTSVAIPNNVTSIGTSAFAICVKLTSITYNGTTAQWSAITKGDYWKNQVPSTCIVHCTDGDIPINEA